MSMTLGEQAAPLTEQYGIQLIFIFCGLLSARRCRRYLARNLWLVAGARSVAHSQSLANVAAITKEVAGIEMYS